MNAKQLRELADNVFGKKTTLLSLWQEQSEHFYPERADFTFKRYLGDDFAANLMTSFPVLCRRDLADQVGQMLRPTAKEWFHMTTGDSRREDNEARRYLQWAEGTMRRAMYDPKSLFDRATKEGDNDFSCFGQTAISVTLNRNRNGLLYRCWHLRDMAWQEDQEGKVCPIFRRWKPTIHTLVQTFGKAKLDDKITKKADKHPFEEVQCLHMIVDAQMYDDKANGRPYWSIHYDCDNDKVIEAVAVWNKEYAIPRWQTVSGSQYAFSPATVAALPEARLIQAMAYTLLEAGEKVVNPPLIATEQAVRSDMAVYAGGVTWVDYDYDEKLGAALRPMTIDAKGMPLGVEMQKDSRNMIAQCFYLNKLRPFNPSTDPTMTAFQAGQIVQDWVRQALPLFAPMEASYNGALCELTFDLLLREGGFGPPQEMPRSLRGAEIQWRFESPLHDAIESQKAHKFMQMKALTADALALDKSVIAIPDAKVAYRDALEGMGIPAKWMRSEVTVAEMEAIQQQQAEAQELLGTMQAGADVVATGAAAAKDLAQAEAA